MVQLRLATFNIRNVTDRYEERKPLLGTAFAEIAADIIGLQEVMFSEPRQDDYLSAQLPGRHYRAFTSRHEKYTEFGNAVLCGLGDVLAGGDQEAAWGYFGQTVRSLAKSPLVDGVAVMTFEMDAPEGMGERIASALRACGAV